MSWVNVGNIKGDTGATGSNGSSAYVTVDRTHGFIVFGDYDSEYMVYFSELKGDTGATGPAGPVNMTSTLDTTDTVNAVTNSAIASEFESLETLIGTITQAQQSNLTLLGS